MDDLSTIAFASNQEFYERTKYIEFDIHFVRDKVVVKEIELRHVASVDQMAYIFMKKLSYQFFSNLRNKLGICTLCLLELSGSVHIKRLKVMSNNFLISFKFFFSNLLECLVYVS